MDFRYLRAFLETARDGSFTQAARRLSIAQSAVSRQVRLFEESVGRQLFVRTNRTVLLTEDGRRLFKEAKRWQEWSDAAFTDRPSLLRIGSLEGILSNWLLPGLQILAKDSKLNLEVRTGTSESLQRSLEGGELDLVFTNKRLEGSVISARKLATEELVLIGPKGADFRDLSAYRWIYGQSGEALAKISKKKSPTWLRIESLPSLLKMVESGAGIAVVPRHLVTAAFKGAVSELRGPASGSIYLSQLNFDRVPASVARALKVFGSFQA